MIRVSKAGRSPVQAIIPGGAAPLLSSEVVLKLPEKEDELQHLNRMTTLLWRAQKLSGLGRYTEASRIADDLLAEEPQFVGAHLLKATILFLSKNTPKAQEEWKKALEIDPANEEAARAFVSLGELDNGASRAVGNVHNESVQEWDSSRNQQKFRFFRPGGAEPLLFPIAAPIPTDPHDLCSPWTGNGKSPRR